MKIARFVTVFLILVVALAQAGERRISVLYCHYSVGGQMVRAYCNIRDQLDTIRPVIGTDTARIVFREYYLNYERDYGVAALSDTVHHNCDEHSFPDFDYDLIDPYNRTQIWGTHAYPTSGILEYNFNLPNKESMTHWKVFQEHNVPGFSGDSVLEKYDIILIKNPYICWSGTDQAASDSIKKFYSAVRDTVANHPEIHLGLLFGTPHYLGMDGVDTIQARYTYQTATWFASDSFFTHSNFGPYKNLWKHDSYRLLCEMDMDSINRFCLQTQYWGIGDPSSHLSVLGSEVSQDTLAAFIGSVARDILIQESGPVSREEIDQAILMFRNGEMGMEEVQEMIQRYNLTAPPAARHPGLFEKSN